MKKSQPNKKWEQGQYIKEWERARTLEDALVESSLKLKHLDQELRACGERATDAVARHAFLHLESLARTAHGDIDFVLSHSGHDSKRKSS